ncbi:MAG: hypothetical protein AAF311_12450, partial [Pseudomonadota bacterium]
RKIGGGWDETQSRSRYTLNEDHVTGSIFMSDHPKPEAIWMPGYPVHPNTTRRVAGMTYLDRSPQSDVQYYVDMFGSEPVHVSDERVMFTTPRGEFFELIKAETAAGLFPGVAPLNESHDIRGCGYTMEVESLERCELVLRDGGVPCRKDGHTLFTEAPFGCGMAMAFIEA